MEQKQVKARSELSEYSQRENEQPQELPLTLSITEGINVFSVETLKVVQHQVEVDQFLYKRVWDKVDQALKERDEWKQKYQEEWNLADKMQEIVFDGYSRAERDEDRLHKVRQRMANIKSQLSEAQANVLTAEEAQHFLNSYLNDAAGCLLFSCFEGGVCLICTKVVAKLKAQSQSEEKK